MTSNYYALVYFTVTGQIIDEIPLVGIPQWLQQINADGSWSIQTQIGPDDGTSGPTRAHLRGVTDAWRHSIAICWGTGSTSDYVCQAGPLVARQLMSEQPPILQLGGTGLWPLFRKIMNVASTWNGNLLSTSDANTTYTSSLQGIASLMLSNAVARQSIPIDIPAPISGTVTQTYFGYDLISVGQRLQELTQLSQGPDILFKPYRTADGHVRHVAQIGNPYISNAGRPLVFDYPGNVMSILPTDDGSSLATKTYEKGNGIEYATLWTSTTDTTLPTAGWPTLEVADNSHASEIDMVKLQAFSDGAQRLNGRTISTWAPTVRQDDVDYPFGSYDPGVFGSYNVVNHCWLPDGAYNQRILGFTQGQKVGELVHLLQSTVT